MNSRWARPTPLEMDCPDCRRIIPKGTVRHTCTTSTGEPKATAETVAQQPNVMRGGRRETVPPPAKVVGSVFASRVTADDLPLDYSDPRRQ